MSIKITLPERLNPDLFPTGGGISVKGSVAFFDPEKWTADSAQVFAADFDARHKYSEDGADLGYCKSDKFSKVKAFEPTDVELALANERLGGGITKESHVFVEFKAANTRVDRDGDQLTRNFLEGMAKNAIAEKIFVLADHDSRQKLGRVYDATVSPSGDGDHYNLIEKAILSRKAKPVNLGGQTPAEALEDKMLDFVSVRFRTVNRPERVEVQEGVYINRIDAPEGAMVEHSETSFVFMGAQRGARLKSADFAPVIEEPKKTVKKMEFEIKSFKLTAEGETVKGVSEVVAHIDSLEAQLKAEKEKNAAMLQPSIDGILATQTLFKEAKKELPIIWTEDELKGFAFEKLQTMHSTLVKSYQSEVKGIDPTKGEPAPEKTKSHIPKANF